MIKLARNICSVRDFLILLWSGIDASHDTHDEEDADELYCERSNVECYEKGCEEAGWLPELAKAAAQARRHSIY